MASFRAFSKPSDPAVEVGNDPSISYVVRGAVLECECGSNPNILNLPMCHGAYIQGKPLMNVGDSKNIVNIPATFGVCEALGEPCQPQVNMEWLNGKNDVLIDGKAVLTSDSYVMCMKHPQGIIYIADDGQQKG
ncbi:DUF4280 domain-containing protein [Paenibacillus kribbensis]|uniref:DUF4280 domain-containing protein n=1 Tax=Paenibacillus TaxID=44249 RepID=UPI00024EF9B8|nr:MULTISPECIES: DUF4280 domain-containing protein [Paenibacillus]EHS57787.1 hypothetical protein WG8_2260 [Paenibacillus sp. Aloe-11]MEC0236535.1 DUF4280 domain-containing protein [Paenibacillus kribbensis]